MPRPRKQPQEAPVDRGYIYCEPDHCWRHILACDKLQDHKRCPAKCLYKKIKEGKEDASKVV